MAQVGDKPTSMCIISMIWYYQYYAYDSTYYLCPYNNDTEKKSNDNDEGETAETADTRSI